MVGLTAVHHTSHHLGQVGRPGREVGIFEDLHTRLEVRDDNSRVGPDLEAKDVAVFFPELEETGQQVVREVMNGSKQGNVERSGGEMWRKLVVPVDLVGEEDNES